MRRQMGAVPPGGYQPYGAAPGAYDGAVGPMPQGYPPQQGYYPPQQPQAYGAPAPPLPPGGYQGYPQQQPAPQGFPPQSYQNGYGFPPAGQGGYFPDRQGAGGDQASYGYDGQGQVVHSGSQPDLATQQGGYTNPVQHQGQMGGQEGKPESYPGAQQPPHSLPAGYQPYTSMASSNSMTSLSAGLPTGQPGHQALPHGQIPQQPVAPHQPYHYQSIPASMPQQYGNGPQMSQAHMPTAAVPTGSPYGVVPHMSHVPVTQGPPQAMQQPYYQGQEVPQQPAPQPQSPEAQLISFD